MMFGTTGWLIAAICVHSVDATAEECASTCDADITCGWYQYKSACLVSSANTRPDGFVKVNAVRTGCDSQYRCLICPSDETGAYTFFEKQYINSILYVSALCSHLSSAPFDNNILLRNFTHPLILRESMSMIGSNTIRVGQDIRVTGNNNVLHKITLAAGNKIVLDEVSVDGLVIDQCTLFAYDESALVVIIESTIKNMTVTLPPQPGMAYLDSFGVAIAHVDGDMTIVCSSASKLPSMIVQQTIQNKLDVTQTNCNESLDVNITDLLAIYGSEYEVEFYHDGNYVIGNQYLRTTATRSFYAVAILIGLIILCNPDILYVFFFQHRYKKSL